MRRDNLRVMLEVQENDIQMIRLARLKSERTAELERIRLLRDDIHHQVVLKESEVIELKKQIKLVEVDVAELATKIQKLEAQQNSVRKVEEFNALTHEISSMEREKAAKEQRLSDHYDKLAAEEDYLKTLKANYVSTGQNCQELETEIRTSIQAINQEGAELLIKRAVLAAKADPEILAVYERLLKNRRDRVIVPIENRCCSGCHILVTAQHESMVRRGDKVIFCEHCSRIHYWHDAASYEVEGEGDSSTRRRKKAAPVKL